jgi:hypothetical protein
MRAMERESEWTMNNPSHQFMWAIAGLLFLIAARTLRDPKNPQNPKRMIPALVLAVAGMACFIRSIFH